MVNLDMSWQAAGISAACLTIAAAAASRSRRPRLMAAAGFARETGVLLALFGLWQLVGGERPHATSARNVWPATVTGLTMLADRVRLDLHGEPSALADVTPAAVSELSLRPGRQVWLCVKATDLEVYARADGAG